MRVIYLFIHFAMKSLLGDDFAGNKKLLKNCRILMQGLKLSCSFSRRILTFKWVKLQTLLTEGSRAITSEVSDILAVPKVNTTTFGLRSWRYIAARPWNSLSDDHRTVLTYKSFKNRIIEVYLRLADVWSRQYRCSLESGGGGGGTPLNGLYGDVPLDKVWFSFSLSFTGYIMCTSLSLTGYIISRKVCPKQCVWFVWVCSNSKQGVGP